MISEDDKGGFGGGSDSFAAMFEAEVRSKPTARQRQLKVGARVEAVVIQIGSDSVFVELDGKQQAFIEASELRGDDGELKVSVGEKIRAHVVEVDERRGIVRLGNSLGKPGDAAALEQARASGVAVEGKVTGVNKGGLEVELGGTRAFCPISQASDRYLEDATTLVGQTLRFLVTEIREGGRNVTLSRRAALAQEAAEGAEKALRTIVVDAVLRGTVTSVRDFGAFVDLGGVEGMIPRSEIAHDRSVAVADALKAGDVVEVQVREIKDGESKRGPAKKITLSLKALAADPWAGLEVREGLVVRGTVTRATEFGRFVRIAPGVEGLLHVSELDRNTEAEEGLEVVIVIKKLDRESKKISLALAPEGAEVGSTLAVKTGAAVAINSVVNGTVERIETYGIFVQLDGTKGRSGRGLVPNAELGVPRGVDVRKEFPEGSKVKAKVLEVGEGRLRLSIKGALDAEERADYEAIKSKQGASRSLGTFADLLKGRKL